MGGHLEEHRQVDPDFDGAAQLPDLGSVYAQLRDAFDDDGLDLPNGWNVDDAFLAPLQPHEFAPVLDEMTVVAARRAHERDAGLPAVLATLALFLARFDRWREASRRGAALTVIVTGMGDAGWMVRDEYLMTMRRASYDFFDVYSAVGPLSALLQRAYRSPHVQMMDRFRAAVDRRRQRHAAAAHNLQCLRRERRTSRAAPRTLLPAPMSWRAMNFGGGIR